MAAVADRPLLDRWALSELHRTVAEVDAALEDFDTARAGRRLAAFIDDLSNWYVRRSRRRFWDGDPAALATLHECLEVLTRLLAPFTPFVTEAVHRALVNSVWPDLPDSVHLRDWPRVDPDGGLPRPGAGRAGRAGAPAGRAGPVGPGRVEGADPAAAGPGAGRPGAGSAGWAALPAELRAQVADELNVQSVEALGAAGGELVDVTVKPNFRALGKRFGPAPRRSRPRSRPPTRPGWPPRSGTAARPP